MNADKSPGVANQPIQIRDGEMAGIKHDHTVVAEDFEHFRIVCELAALGRLSHLIEIATEADPGPLDATVAPPLLLESLPQQTKPLANLIEGQPEGMAISTRSEGVIARGEHQFCRSLDGRPIPVRISGRDCLR